METHYSEQRLGKVPVVRNTSQSCFQVLNSEFSETQGCIFPIAKADFYENVILKTVIQKSELKWRIIAKQFKLLDSILLERYKCRVGLITTSSVVFISKIGPMVSLLCFLYAIVRN